MQAKCLYACGGFCKSHIDTPHADEMFESLVIWLPTQFTGGELIMYHHKQEIRSSSAGTSLRTLHWAAFFSDVEHEVLPVGEDTEIL